MNGLVTTSPQCETDITLWSLLIKATMAFKAGFEFDLIWKISPSTHTMTFQDFHPISFFCTVGHHNAQEGHFPAILESSFRWIWNTRPCVLDFPASRWNLLYCPGMSSNVMWPFLRWLAARCEWELNSVSPSHIILAEWLFSPWPLETHQNAQGVPPLTYVCM